MPTHDFVGWDDDVNVYQNPHLAPVTTGSVLHLWRHSYSFLYVPLTYTTWAAIASFAHLPPHLATPGGEGSTLNPHAFHAVNLLLHIVNVLLVFVILRLLLRDDWAACAGAALFGLHPVQVESVAWITELKGVLCGVFSLLALWQYLHYALSQHETEALPPPRRHYVLALVAFILALLAKPSAVAVPLIAAVLDHWLVGRRIRRVTHDLAAWLVIAALWIVLTRSVQPVGQTPAIALWARLFVAGDTLAFYLGKLVWPIQLAFDYGRRPDVVLSQTWGYVAWLAPCILALVIYRERVRRPWLVAMAGVFVVGVLPVLGLVPFAFQKYSTVADRYLYLAMLGPALGLAYVLHQHKSRSVLAGCLLLLLLLGFVSFRQSGHWANSHTLFTHALEVNPRSWTAHNNLGFVLGAEGRTAEAVEHYRQALRLKPDFIESQYNLGRTLVEQGKNAEAITHLQETLRLQPGPEMRSLTHLHFGTALAAQGRITEAMGHYQEALRLKPDLADAHVNMGNALMSQGRDAEAAEHYEQALRLVPGSATAHNNLGLALAAQGQTEAAIAHYHEALRLNPDDAETHYNFGLALGRQGKTEEAVAHFRSGLRLKPDYVEAHYNLGVTLMMQGRRSEAVAHWITALRLRPGYAPAKNALAAVRNSPQRLGSKAKRGAAPRAP